MIDKIYLGKIGLGMAAVFGIGMAVNAAVSQGSREFRRVAHSDATLTVPLLGMAFRTAKGELGSMQELRIRRSAPEVIEGFDLTVTLNDGVSADQFNNCEITVVDPQNLDKNTLFTCLTAADSGFEDLVQFGLIHFQPSGATHRLMIPQSVRDEIQRQDAPAAPEPPAVAEGAPPVEGAERISEPGRLNIMINGKPVIDIRGDSEGGAVMIRNPETGEPIVDIGDNHVKVNVDSP